MNQKMIVGTRKEEGSKRAKKPRIDVFTKKKIHYKVIFDWLEWHIWDYIDRFELPYPSPYDEGFHRLGCVVCPFRCRNNQGEMNLWKEKWPTYFKAFEHATKYWWDNVCVPKYGDRFGDSWEEYIDDWYHDAIWKKDKVRVARLAKELDEE
jgi:phosphoadenosine phosphosulfate reductase